MKRLKVKQNKKYKESQNYIDSTYNLVVYYLLSSRDVVTMFGDNYVSLHRIYINFTKKRKSIDEMSRR